MKYYCYNTWNGNPAEEPYVEVMSEKEILELYYDHWYDAMVSKFGKEVVDKDYCKDDCIDDWVIVNWAWLSTDK
jgi:hypothetical protein